MKYILTILSALFVLSGTALADTNWQYINEVSIAEVFNTLYGTNYDTEHMEGLDALRSDYGATMYDVWNTNQFPAIQVPVFDSSSTSSLGIWYGDGFNTYAELFSPGAWTPDSRGYMPNGGPVIDLVSLVGVGKEFKFAVGSVLLTSTNSIALNGDDGSLFIGYNEGGFSQDEDFNEPLIHSAATPIPGAVWLLGSGLLGLVGLRKRFMV